MCKNLCDILVWSPSSKCPGVVWLDHVWEVSLGFWSISIPISIASGLKLHSQFISLPVLVVTCILFKKFLFFFYLKNILLLHTGPVPPPSPFLIPHLPLSHLHPLLRGGKASLGESTKSGIPVTCFLNQCHSGVSWNINVVWISICPMPSEHEHFCSSIYWPFVFHLLKAIIISWA